MRTEGTQLPPEVWIKILSFLPHVDIARALCVCRSLNSISQEAYRAACFRRWPAWAPIAEYPGAKWSRVYELLQLRDAETAALLDVEKLGKCQTVINARHRAILTEWLCEVTFEWDLDSSVVFEAVKHLDWYLSRTAVEKLGSFQLVGLACLRTAMRDFPRGLHSSLLSEELLDPKRFAQISDDTYTPEQVQQVTETVSSTNPAELQTNPNQKMHLRSFWFRAIACNAADEDELHIYTLASFLLQLALLDMQCSGFAPSYLAAAALSLAFTAFNKPAWPRCLEAHGAYTLTELAPIREQLATLQAAQDAPQLRLCWKRLYNLEDTEHAAFQEEWKKMVTQIFSCSSTTLTTALRNCPSSGSASITTTTTTTTTTSASYQDALSSEDDNGVAMNESDDEEEPLQKEKGDAQEEEEEEDEVVGLFMASPSSPALVLCGLALSSPALICG